MLIVANTVENGAPIGLGDADAFWHSDLSCKEKPSLGSLLHAQELPASGKGAQALFVNVRFTTGIVGLPDDEGQALLQALFTHSTQDRRVDRHVDRQRWQPHDLVFQDKRSLQHLAAGCPPEQRRKLDRTTVEGDEPVRARGRPGRGTLPNRLRPRRVAASA